MEKSAAILDLNLNDVMEDMFMVLTNKEKDIIVKRFGLDSSNKHTLESIGQSLNVTRERVRQIENIALGKLRRIYKNTRLKELNITARELLVAHGGLMLEEQLVSEVLNSLPQSSTIDGTIIRLALNIDDSLIYQRKTYHFHPFWHLNTITRDQIEEVLKTTFSILNSKNNTIEENQLVAQVINRLAAKNVNTTPQFISSALTIDHRFKITEEGVGLASWRFICPKSIRDKAFIILKKENHPLHFVDIANKILEYGFDKKVVTVQAVHNELIRYDTFVLVGRGLYALREWGFEHGTVSDIIEMILSKASRPLTKKEIIEGVLKQRKVKIGTISLNLQNFPQFVRVGRAVYELDLNKKRK